MNPYRHRDVFNANDFLNRSIVDFCKAEVKVAEDLDHFER